VWGTRRSIGFKVALVAGLVQVVATLTLNQGWAATFLSNALPLIFAAVLIVLCQAQARDSTGPTRTFWLLNSAAFVALLFSQAFWFYWEGIRGKVAPNPLPGDGFFFLMSALMLAALAFRPHSGSSAADLHFQRLDLAFLLCWWFCLYLYFAVPWLTVVHDFPSYNPSNYFLVLAEQSAVIIALFLLWRTSAGSWRKFYGHAALGILVYALANFVQGLAIDRGKYYSGSIYDVPLCLGGLWVVYAFSIGPHAQAVPDPRSVPPDRQGLWTARLTMAALISLPLLGLYGYLEGSAPAAILAFRLRLILAATLFLGTLGFLRMYFMERKLQRLISVTESSYESLKAVQERLADSQKLAALGRLAAGAAHEINNPLTAIYCYSELLADNPSLSPKERQLAQGIREQVRLAQAAVLSIHELKSDALGAFRDPLQR